MSTAGKASERWVEVEGRGGACRGRAAGGRRGGRGGANVNSSINSNFRCMFNGLSKAHP